MKWTRVEVADPILQKARRGELRTLWVNGEPMAVRRVVRPTVAYVERLPPFVRWAVSHDDASLPFAPLVRSGPAEDLEQPDAEHERG
jgi:hypothetical protein